MDEIMKNLLYMALLVCVPLTTIYAKKGISAAVSALGANVQDVQVQALLREIGEAVSDAVAATGQTYVNDLKASGTFDPEKQQEALEKAVEAAMDSLSNDSKEWIDKTYGDSYSYLVTRIEAQIGMNKAAEKAAAQNILRQL